MRTFLTILALFSLHSCSDPTPATSDATVHSDADADVSLPADVSSDALNAPADASDLDADATARD